MFLSAFFLPWFQSPISQGDLEKLSLGLFLLCKMFAPSCPACGWKGMILRFCGAPLGEFPACLDRSPGSPGLSNKELEPSDLPGPPQLSVLYSVKPSSREALFRPPRKNWEPLHKRWPVGSHGLPFPVRPWGCFWVLLRSGQPGL